MRNAEKIGGRKMKESLQKEKGLQGASSLKVQPVCNRFTTKFGLDKRH